MLTLLFALLFSALSVTACVANGVSSGYTLTAGIAGFLLAMLLAGRWVARRIGKVQTHLQTVMQDGQKRIQRDIQHFQSRPGGNPRAIQGQLERKQQQMIRESLALVDQFEPFRKWNLLMGRQINTMRLQFHYQLKEFEEVDALLAKRGLLSKPLLTEPLAVGMKMTRQFKRDDLKGVEKTFKKHVKWFRGDRASLVVGLMAWIYVKKGEIEPARQLLAKYKDRTGNEVLTRNWEQLSNGREKISNKGLGEEWYALGLENPPQAKPQRMRGGKGKGPKFL